MPGIDDFKAALRQHLADAERQGASSIDVNSGELHRAVGGYPSTRHSMPTCCTVMYGEQRADDLLISRPPKGRGATLTIRYKLPR